jgi:hypothetical protein
MKALASVLLIAAMVTPAAAQSADESAPRFNMGSRDLFASESQQRATNPVVVRAHAGAMFWGGGSGVIFGGGFGTRPFENKQLELTGDVSFVRFEGFNGFYASTNVAYHFNNAEENTSPFAGGGLAIVHLPGDTQVRPQILAGIELNKKGKPIRPEIRFIFTRYEVMTVIMVSIDILSR